MPKTYTFLDVEQGSEEWLLKRQGKLTPSILFKACCSSPKVKNKILKDLIMPPPLKNNNKRVKNFVHGHKFEGIAVGQLQEIFSKHKFLLNKFAISNEFPLLAGSPDVLCLKEDNLDFGIEIKAPVKHDNIIALQNKILPEQYIYQVIGYCLLFDLDEWLFCVIDPNEKIKHFIIKTSDYKKVSSNIKKTLEEFNNKLTNVEMF